MSDASRTGKDAEDDKILTDFDQTNGLVDGLGGDDDGALIGEDALIEDDLFDDDEVVHDDVPVQNPLLDGLALDTEPAATDEDSDPSVTPYSEEGRP